jgi:predicted transcriptional regulator
MTVHLSECLEDELRRLATLRGQGIDAIVEEAVRQYLDAVAITDVTDTDLAATQTRLMDEMPRQEGWPEGGGLATWGEPKSGGRNCHRQLARDRWLS